MNFHFFYKETSISYLKNYDPQIFTFNSIIKFINFYFYYFIFIQLSVNYSEESLNLDLFLQH